ncbi:MAG: 1-deoxy-D-xylulose-5-phosphate reductoisomerase [Bacteroidetes bacterium GWF2_42_66]|nr:MAG: 1-deoxy-D-xylulose-5-phosphate reductoisomerase [Bacteroidetes bacterium GWA2_42_15]OFY01783.1 MAG: 1-deoxy-D-xylulose-5-phosphate reductoisomerase [Bacteroidetes bacterium GWE2_42_39]OFY44924.1 MAG: 1-deoxy-D-xylulose-5-phosphate reductoisomerase [Bacteroidetes bacterium GWF2_42_66]HBL76054.1 1-deoxy-D-xylulose-5-phosphate reductoisomerase [Prolixibacteraceae bacterium]HCR89679.1 1-deoxy-D-xylulose-5-phosphate reductoisomerase [Prolixibacteraceae bacterium]
MKKRIAILGSTGSIGTQALEVVDQYPDRFEVEVLTANNSIELLIQQAKKYQPNVVVIANECRYEILKEALKNEPIKVFAGSKAIADVVQMDTVDIVLTAMVGYSGLMPTFNAAKAGKQIALANKETMVVAGEIINQVAIENNASILPVDSEHSAIFQCLSGEFNNEIEKIYLTASGGPFRGYSMEQLQKVTKDDALKHPNWSMGTKLTIDSASMMNKGFEIIEAKWLFGLKLEQIDVIIHPQSIVHSLVQFRDGSIKAQMGLPDMKLPILYALSYPQRLPSNFERFNFLDHPKLTFEQPDPKNFRNLALAYEALRRAGNMPCILNAANEIVVQAFLKDQLRFVEMPDIIEESMQKTTFIKNPDLNDYIQTDKEVRLLTYSIIKEKLKIKTA